MLSTKEEEELSQLQDPLSKEKAEEIKEFHFHVYFFQVLLFYCLIL
jgi:hypothetical protein